jgi:hypothetical protein
MDHRLPKLPSPKRVGRLLHGGDTELGRVEARSTSEGAAPEPSDVDAAR